MREENQSEAAQDTSGTNLFQNTQTSSKGLQSSPEYAETASVEIADSADVPGPSRLSQLSKKRRKHTIAQAAARLASFSDSDTDDDESIEYDDSSDTPSECYNDTSDDEDEF